MTIKKMITKGRMKCPYNNKSCDGKTYLCNKCKDDLEKLEVIAMVIESKDIEDERMWKIQKRKKKDLKK